jgi:hypothetical protein
MRDYIANPIQATTTIAAPLARCFFLSTRVELVKETLGMKLVDDPAPNYVRGGHIVAHSRVHWRGWKFGLLTHHHTLITGYSEPHAAKGTEMHADQNGQPVAWFQDSQAKGRFAFFRHDHYFREVLSATGAPMTILYDEVRFTLPFGILGALASSLLLAPHVERLCAQRFGRLKGLAESDGWREWVEPGLVGSDEPEEAQRSLRLGQTV